MITVLLGMTLLSAFTDEFINILFNGLTPAQFFAYYIFGILGLFTAWALDIYGKWKVIKSRGGFSFKYWWDKNAFRAVISFILVFIGIICTQEILGSTVSVYNAIVTGLGADKIIHAFTKRAKRIGEDETN